MNAHVRSLVPAAVFLVFGACVLSIAALSGLPRRAPAPGASASAGGFSR